MSKRAYGMLAFKAIASTSAAAIAVAAVGAGNACAGDIAVENTPFISSRTQAEVQADLKTPYLGGYPGSFS